MFLTTGKLSVLRAANLAPMALHYVKSSPAIQALHLSATMQHSYAGAAQKRLRHQMSSDLLAPLSTRSLHKSIPAGQWATYDPKFTLQGHYKAFSQKFRCYSTKSELKTESVPFPTTTTTVSSSSSSASSSSSPSSSSSSSSSSPAAQTGDKLSKKEQLKRAFKDYGATIVAFHVGISLISLGGFYALVSSGINFVPVLEWLGIASSAIAEKVATGSTFVVAYAVHKVFAPVRISITLGSTPFIVRYLRSKGFMKPKSQGK